MPFVDPTYSGANRGSYYVREGVVACPRKGGQDIAFGRCMMMRDEDKKPCNKIKCEFRNKKFDLNKKRGKGRTNPIKPEKGEKKKED